MASIVKYFADLVVSLFFTSAEVINSRHVPSHGPLLIVANHNNQFVDAAMVFHVIQRPVSLIIAEASMHRCIIGQLARLANSVPVVRPQDMALPGKGEIIGVDLESLMVQGKGTEFINQAEVGGKLDIKNVGQFVVKEIKSNTEMLVSVEEELSEEAVQVIRKAFENVDETNRGLNYKLLPKVDQHEVYAKVIEKLGNNGAIAIFPEGGSHDQTHLLPLKAGVAVMALGALSKGVENVKILPIGLNYFKAGIWRSRVMIQIGEAFSVKPELFELYEQGRRRVAYEGLMEDVRQNLLKVTLNAPNYQVQRLVRTARRLYQNGVELSAEQYLLLYRRFLNGYSTWIKDPKFADLVKEISMYLIKAESLGLSDKDVQMLPPHNSCFIFMWTYMQIMFTLVVGFIVLLFCLPGYLLNLPLFYLIRRKVELEVKKALANSKVKVDASDVRASQKVISAVKYLPICYLTNAVVCLLLLYFLYEKSSSTNQSSYFTDNLYWLVPILLLIVLPFYSFVGVYVFESGYRRQRLLPMQFYILCSMATLFSPRSHPQSDIRLQRRNLVLKTQQVVKDLTKDDPEWQEDPIINEKEMETRRYALAQDIVQLLERKRTGRKYLRSLNDPDIEQVLSELSNDTKLVTATI